MKIIPMPSAIRDVKHRLYTLYDSAADISYAPELALKEGAGMVKEIEEGGGLPQWGVAPR